MQCRSIEFFSLYSLFLTVQSWQQPQQHHARRTRVEYANPLVQLQGGGLCCRSSTLTVRHRSLKFGPAFISASCQVQCSRRAAWWRPVSGRARPCAPPGYLLLHCPEAVTVKALSAAGWGAMPCLSCCVVVVILRGSQIRLGRPWGAGGTVGFMARMWGSRRWPSKVTPSFTMQVCQHLPNTIINWSN